MVRSSGFGSTTRYSRALFRLAFASAPRLYLLTSHQIVTRRPVLQKVRHQTGQARSPLSACKHTVSGSLSLPSRGSFHLSLTVLFAIGHMVVFSLTGWSPHVPSEFLVFRRTLCICSLTFSPTSLSLSSGRLSNRLRLRSVSRLIPEEYFYSSFGLLRFRSPLLAESFLLSFPPGTKMFQFPGFPPLSLCVQDTVTRHYSC